MDIITYFIWLATPRGLTELKIQDRDEQQAVHETVLKQVLAPSEKYICHLCANRLSIVDGEQSRSFLTLIAQLLEICPYYQPTLEVVLNMPILLTIPSCLTFFECDHAIWYFLREMDNDQLEWNKTRGYQRQMRKQAHRA
ncbi:hypothetical protein BLNAU_24096 [Blattamonas nauphoetae]|uniref:Uncharacterized protein n=1 Tax=Blattamonas nauphoetae TaxID=2049346 RepID=A0ABQ9WQE7_9EUKA|nr:hypothetical protein BLNAU_24096 [Blattamonas nauphoetae]